MSKPWSTNGAFIWITDDKSEIAGRGHLISFECTVVGDDSWAQAEVRANRIVTAVNSHASLTECVKVLREALERTIAHVPNTRSGTAEAARAAISRAKELVP